MRQNIDKLIDLVKKTGDKMVIVDREDGETAWVLMSLSDYEKLVANERKIAGSEENLTIFREEDKIEKINEDIAILQEKERDGEIEEIFCHVREEKDKEETDSQFYFEPVE